MPWLLLIGLGAFFLLSKKADAVPTFGPGLPQDPNEPEMNVRMVNEAWTTEPHSQEDYNNLVTALLNASAALQQNYPRAGAALALRVQWLQQHYPQWARAPY